ncbi:ER lumen protein retaining receptor family protein [Zea mays]|uniref:ER lumen protein retaining receptor family protein n=1 Tax=Zea mays TaxID=4577 RepID=A0A1D6QMS1_MAIZE|nr:ER lumen protein retaining receptor family protein [Zea mays]AQK58945.1 ER lumen protein retaining receptor family protein [Zea mays]
MDPDCWNI